MSISMGVCTLANYNYVTFVANKFWINEEPDKQDSYKRGCAV